MNRRLIAAAPDLLHALNEMLRMHGKPHRDEWINDAGFEEAKQVDACARAAIAKATVPAAPIPTGADPAPAVSPASSPAGADLPAHLRPACPYCDGTGMARGYLCAPCDGWGYAS